MASVDMFNIPSAPGDTSRPKPTWVSDISSTEQMLFEEINATIVAIETRIHDGNFIAKRSRKISRSEISSKFGLNDSFITSRRHPKLSKFIDDENARLELIYQSKQSIQNRTNHRKTLTQMTKKELIGEIHRLRKVISDSDHEAVLAQVEHIINSDLSVSQRRTSIRFETQKIENEENLKQIAQLIYVRQGLEEELSSEIDKRKKLEYELKCLRDKT